MMPRQAPTYRPDNNFRLQIPQRTQLGGFHLNSRFQLYFCVGHWNPWGPSSRHVINTSQKPTKRTRRYLIPDDSRKIKRDALESASTVAIDAGSSGARTRTI